MQLSVDDILRATPGALVAGSEATLVSGVSTDSRTIRPGELFVPLAGTRYDGHDFIAAAIQQGAAGLLWHRTFDLALNVAAIRVRDTLHALSDLATWALKRLDAPVIAVAGSNGKTTTKELIAHLLGQRFKTHATPGNFNTEIGLPLTILNAPEDTEMLVLEMGTTAQGDLKRLCQIASPQIGVLTSISEEHTATLGSLKEILDAEVELIETLPPEGLAIVNGDSPEVLEAVRRRARCRCVTFGFSAENDVVAEDIRVSRHGTRWYLRTPAWQTEMAIPLLGRPAALAALAATAVAQHFGFSFAEIRRGLASARGAWGRLQFLQIIDTNITVLHDAYNANPASMREAILCAAQMREPDEELIFVLGDMLELGPISARAHREIGQLITRPELRPDQLIAIGPWAQTIGDEASGANVNVQRFSTSEEAADALASELGESNHRALVLLKGSRGMRLEKISEALQRQPSLQL